MVLDYVPPEEAERVMAMFRQVMPPGSFLILSIGINNNTPEVAELVIKMFTASTVHVHSREQIAGYFAGLEMVEPGLTEAGNWRWPYAQITAGSRPADVLAGVGRKS